MHKRTITLYLSGALAVTVGVFIIAYLSGQFEGGVRDDANVQTQQRQHQTQTHENPNVLQTRDITHSALQDSVNEREKWEQQEQERNAWNKSQDIEEEGISPIDIQMQSLEAALFQYREAYGSFPQGGNHPVASALLGRDNLKRNIFLNWHRSRIAPSGEVLDAWGTPFYIQISGGSIEVRSAGPNHIFRDEDDRVFQYKASE